MSERTPAAGQVELAAFTTLGLGGPARRYLEADTASAVVAGVSAADEAGEPLLVLGGGSNLVIADEGFDGTVLRIVSRGLSITPGGDGTVEVTVAAGEDWDAVVERTVHEGLAGLECLSGIPGRAGATPIQNVGAYGQEVAQTVIRVRAYDRARREVTDIAAQDCGFGYRDSAFKRSARAAARAGATPEQIDGGHPGIAGATGRYVILSVTFRLHRSPLGNPVGYAELARALGLPDGGRAALGDVRSAVLALRRGKGMVLDDGDPDSRSAGSFFTNPVLDCAQFAALEHAVTRACGEGARVPQFPAGEGLVKVSAAWLIERAGFGKGYQRALGGPGDGPMGGASARISTKHTLALVNPGGATTADLLGLAREIRDGVQQVFGVELAAEPVLVGAGI